MIGHQVTILTGYPNYPEGEIYSEFLLNRKKFRKFKGAEIIRVPIFPRKRNNFNLILNYLSFLTNSILLGYFKLYGKKFDAIFTFQLSPATIGITSSFFSLIKHCPNIFWILDLWPDTLIALNILRKGWQTKLFKFLMNWIYSRSDIVLAQSKSILKELNNYSSIKNNAYYFPSWGESELFFNSKLRAPEIISKKVLTIMFAGNIGEAQDFPNVIKAVECLRSRDINNFRIIIIGGGSKKEWLKLEIKKLNLEKYFEVYNYYPLKRMNSFFLHADALLVTLSDRKVFRITIPGKIQFYLSAGIPIIGMICGEGAKVIKNSKSGFVCDSGDYIGLSKIIHKMTEMDKKYLIKMGINGRKYANNHFSKKKLVNKLNKILIKLKNKHLTKSTNF